MTPKTLNLLATLRTLDVKLWAENGQLRYSAPPGQLTTTLRSDLISHKKELLLFFETVQQAQQQHKQVVKLASRQKPLPLSFGQQRLWFLDKLSPGTPTYNIPLAVRLTGALNVTALTKALQTVVDRHEALRTVFGEKRGRPFQKIQPQLTLTLPVIDLTNEPKSEREAHAQTIASQLSQHPFDLTTGPLIKVDAIRLAAEDHILMIVIHHTVFDGWSEEIFFRELSAAYQAIDNGRTAQFPPLPIQYVDFAVWQHKWLSTGQSRKQEAYWQEQLAKPISALSLPTNFHRPRTQTANGAHHHFTITAELSQALKQLSQQEGTTLFTLLLAAFKTLLYRYTGHTDILVGSPIANRTHSEVEDVIGFFVNTVVFRTDLAHTPSFHDLLHQVKRTVLSGYTNQNLPFDRVVDLVHPERDLSYNPLFQVMFAAQNSSLTALDLPGIATDWFEFESGYSLFDLSIDIEEMKQGIKITLEYSTDLFAADTIVRLGKHYETLLHSIVERPYQRIDQLNILPAEERQLLLEEWNGHASDYEIACIHHLFERQVAATPEATAVVYEADRLTYAELNARANQLAHYLIAHGVGPETAVAIYIERSVEMMVAVLGILKAGGAYVPLNLAAPQERLADILQDVKASLLLTQSTLQNNLPHSNCKFIWLDTAWAEIATHSAENLKTAVTPPNLAYAIYTSGSTGRSKGVLINHESLTNAYYAWEEIYQLREKTNSHLQMANFSFDVFGGDWTRALCSGGKLVIAPSDQLLMPEKLYSLMRREAVDCAEFVPAVMRELMAHLLETNQTLDFMNLIAVGSDNWYVGEYRKLQQLCGDNTRLINSYGLTEATIDSSYFENPTDTLSDDLIVPIGRPFPNTQFYILTPSLQPAPIGIPGELYVGGINVARGYLNRPSLTAERFVPNPFSDIPGSRLYRTGDLARYSPTGSIELMGRIDHQIKIRGFRVELGEIETLIDAYLGIQKSVVVLTPQQQLVAYFVAKTDNGSAPEQNEIKAYLKQLLPDYMVPYAYIELPQFPLTSSGKINRTALPPITSDYFPDNNYVPPRDEIEAQLIQLWEELLNVHPINLNSNFFDLGGHSLLAVQLMSRISRRFGLDLPLATLFNHMTPAELATIIRQGTQPQSNSSLVTLQSQGDNPALFFIHPIGGNVFCYLPLVRHLGAERPFYALQSPTLIGEPVLPTLEAMAAYYIAEIQQVQPEGPYLLGGWSLGGVIAIEIARQLNQQGHAVSHMLLLDTYPPDRQDQLANRDTLWVEFLHNLASTVSITLDEDSLALALSQLTEDEQATYVLNEVKRANILPSDYQIDDLKSLFATFCNNAQAVANYALEHIHSDRVVLFQTQETAVSEALTQQTRLQEAASTTIDIQMIAGNHFTFLAEPYVEQLATAIKQSLTP